MACTLTAAAAVVVLMVWARVLFGSAGAFYKGEESLRANRRVQAITYFDRALHWYAPLNPYVERSAERLWALSEMAEKDGDAELALAALNSLRSGFKAAEGLFSPGRQWIEDCEEQMQRLTRGQKEGGSARVVKKAREKGHSPPNVFWTLVLEVGLLGWIGSVFLLVTRDGKSGTRRDLLVWCGLSVFFYAIWLIGMMKA